MTSILLPLCLLLPTAQERTNAQASELRPTNTESVAAVCARFEQEIGERVARADYMSAIRSVAEYEEALFSRHAPATFEDGLFRSHAAHLSFHSFLDDWVVPEVEDEVPDWIATPFFDLLLVLHGEGTSDSLVLMSLDMAGIAQTIDSNSRRKSLTDQELSLAAQMMGSNLGRLESEQWKQLGNQRVHLSRLNTGSGGTDLLAILGNRGRVYAFAFATSGPGSKDNEQSFMTLLKSVTFDYLPPDDSVVEAALARVSVPKDIDQALSCARELAAGAEYGEACDVLSRLRSELSQRMGAPKVVGDKAVYEAYGVEVSNPEPQRWKLTAANDGMGMIMMEDRFNVGEAGIMIGVLDFVVTYGAKAVGLFSTDDDVGRDLLASSGQGALLNIGGKIESERFRMLLGSFCYEGVASLPQANLKAKAFLIPKEDHCVMILMLVSSRQFEKTVGEYEELVNENIRITGR